MMKLLKRQFKSFKITEQALFVLLVLLFTFPFFKENIQSFLTILLGVASMAHAWYYKKILFDKKLLFFFIPFFIVFTDYLLRSNTTQPLSKTLFFLFFPFIFSNIPNRLFSGTNINIFNRILQISALLVCCSYIIQFFIDFDYSDLFTYHYNVPKFRHYIYSEMKLFRIHPTYLTAILTYCIVASLKKTFKKAYTLDLFLVLFYVVFSIFLMTKLNLIFQLSVIFCFLFFKTGLSFIKKTIVIVLLFTTTISFIIYMPNLLDRFTEIQTSLNKAPEGLAFDSTNIRVAIYKCDMELMKNNYWFGVGFDSIQESLNNCYNAKYNAEFYKTENYLSHNYFFYVLIASGILGFIAIIIFWFYLMRLTLKINSFILFVLVLNVFLMCFIEDFFYRQFGLFSFLLLFHAHYKNYLNRQNEVFEDTILVK